MTTVLGSRRTFLDYADSDAMEFLETVCDITAVPEYLRLKDCRHHYSTSRYQHCINVAWYTFIWCKRLHLNYRSAARGAMLHDFFLYDWREGTQPIPGNHCEVHPRIALANAERHFEVDPVMRDCILNHMWPTTANRPHTREGLIITLADKYCATMEIGVTTVRVVPPAITHFLQRDNA